MKKRAFFPLPFLSSFLFLCFFLLRFFSPAAEAAALPYFSFSLDESPASQGDTVRLCIEANRVDDPAAGFRIRVGYDDGLLEYTGAETSSRIGSGTFRINPDGDPIYGVYVCDTSKGYAPSLSGNVISFVFRVKDGARRENTSFSVCVDQICDFSARQLNLTCKGELPLRIDPGPSSEALLDSLEPPAGTLEPEFSPDVYSYTLRVGYDVDSLEFRADAAGGGTVKINRKSLNRAGTDTKIVATVTAEDGKTKAVYTVTVKRSARPLASSAGSRSVPSRAVSAFSGKKPETEDGYVPVSRSGKSGQKSAAVGGRDAAGQIYAPAEASPAPQRSGAEGTEGTNAAARNIYFVGNRMPEYLVGMLACAFCVVTGIALCLWFGITPKKK